LNISRAIAAITLALLSTLCAAQPGLKMNAAAQALVDEGNVLGAQGNLQEALNRFSQANKADPTSSVPLSLIAEVLYQAARQAQGEQQAKLRQQAEALVNQILQKFPDEPLAHEVQRKLREDQPPPLHTANPAALAEMNLGEVAFAKQKFDDALLHYERAATLDPQLSIGLDLCW
jgi:tetratricopeptide (TPR) repeat protein